jgi:adenylate cyclase
LLLPCVAPWLSWPKWHTQGYNIGFGIGIARGFATLGQVGFKGRVDYTPIGTVTNLAARLSSEAKNGQILISPGVANEVRKLALAEDLGPITLKGLSKPVHIHNVIALQTEAIAT